MDTQPKQTTRHPVPWGTIIAFILLLAFAWWYLKGCKGDSRQDTAYQKIDSAKDEEIRRWKDSASFYKQYKWQNQIMGEKLSSTEQAIVQLTRTVQSMELRLRGQVVKVIARTDSVECIQLAGMVNDYIDTAKAYRSLRDAEKTQYEAWLASERGYSQSMRRLLDSCRAVVGVVGSVLPALKPRGEIYLGLAGATNLGYVFAGPEIMYKDKRDRIFRIGYGVGNSKPWYQAGVAVKLKLKR